MKKYYETLEFSMIQKAIKNYCFSEMAKNQVDALKPYHDLDDLKLYQDDVFHAMTIIYAYGRIPLAPYEDIEEIIQKAQKGGVCYPQDFLKIIQILKNVLEIQNYLENDIEKSHLVETMELFYLPKDLYNEIQKCIDPSGNIYDHASPELYRLRRQINAIEVNMRKKIEALKLQNKDYLSHDVISTRNDHFVLPVNVSYKNQVKGIQHGHSSSGRTTYVEPEAIVAYNNQLAQVKQDEQIEIHRILLELTKKVKSYDRVLKENLEIMIDVDVIFAIGEYGKKLDMVLPIVDEDFQGIEMLKARHPLIDQNKIIANDIVLKKPQDILLISGSNTGGKTVALKTAGLLSLMAICGLPIPVKEAKVPLFDEIFVDVGDEQSIEQSLSTFSSHMKRLVAITQEASKKNLVIIDEICSGTDPHEGESLAQAILTYLHEKGAYVLASTHYSALKEYAKESDYIKIASVEFDQEKMKPTYRLIDGSVGNSYAIEISKHLGLNQQIIDHAAFLKSESMTTSQKLLEKLQTEMEALRQQKEELDKLQIEVQNKEKHYQQLLDNYQSRKERMIEKAQDEANDLLKQAQDKADVILKELQGQMKPHQVIQAKKQLDDLKYQKKTQENHEDHDYKIGDIVKVLAVNRQGEIIDINKKGLLTISMGGLKLNAKKSEVQFMHEKVPEKKETSNIRSLRKATKQSFELNIIGMRYEEAMIAVDKFIDNALVSNYSMVRIIHGMGTGVLRKGVRKLLDKNKYVKSYQDGGPNEGGLGATLVYFE